MRRLLAKSVWLVAAATLPIVQLSGQQLQGTDEACRSVATTQDAVRACYRILGNDSTNVEALYNLGVGIASTRQYARAESVWSRYVRLRPRQFAGYYNLGLMLEFQRVYAAALKPFRSALHYASDSRQEQTSCFHIGVVEYNLRRQLSALRWFRAAIAMDTTDLSAWSAAAIAAETLHRDSEAVAYWGRIAKSNANFLEALSPQERADYHASLKRVGEQPPAIVKPSGTCRNTDSEGAGPT